MRFSLLSLMLCSLLLTSAAHTETLRPLPATLDDARLGAGDMHDRASQGQAPFSIWVIQDGITPPDRVSAASSRLALDRPYLKHFTSELNKRLAYLSGGRFGLRLRRIHFVDVTSNSALAKLERRVAALTRGRGFAMIVGPEYDGGSYAGQGVFRIASDEVGVKPYNRKALHEILHALISPAHSISSLSTLEQYNLVVGLDPQESAFLGWPAQPSVSPDSPIFD